MASTLFVHLKNLQSSKVGRKKRDDLAQGKRINREAMTCTLYFYGYGGRVPRSAIGFLSSNNRATTTWWKIGRAHV